MIHLSRFQAGDFKLLLVHDTAQVVVIEHIVKGLILAQNERWRRGLGMQVEREPGATPGKVAKGAVRRG